MLSNLVNSNFIIVILIMSVLSTVGAISIIEALFFDHGAKIRGTAVSASAKHLFTVTLTVYLAADDEIISLTVRYKNEDDICKSIEPVIAVCKELGIFGLITIEFLIERNGVYYDSDELSIELAADGSLTQIST